MHRGRGHGRTSSDPQRSSSARSEIISIGASGPISYATKPAAASMAPSGPIGSTIRLRQNASMTMPTLYRQPKFRLPEFRILARVNVVAGGAAAGWCGREGMRTRRAPVRADTVDALPRRVVDVEQREFQVLAETGFERRLPFQPARRIESPLQQRPIGMDGMRAGGQRRGALHDEARRFIADHDQGWLELGLGGRRQGAIACATLITGKCGRIGEESTNPIEGGWHFRRHRRPMLDPSRKHGKAAHTTRIRRASKLHIRSGYPRKIGRDDTWRSPCPAPRSALVAHMYISRQSRRLSTRGCLPP